MTGSTFKDTNLLGLGTTWALGIVKSPHVTQICSQDWAPCFAHDGVEVPWKYLKIWTSPRLSNNSLNVSEGLDNPPSLWQLSDAKPSAPLCAFSDFTVTSLEEAKPLDLSILVFHRCPSPCGQVDGGISGELSPLAFYSPVTGPQPSFYSAKAGVGEERRQGWGEIKSQPHSYLAGRFPFPK
jgi:hypothetical protein